MGFDDRRVSEDAGRGLSRPARWFVGGVAAWLVADQLTKAAVVAHFGQPGGETIVLIPGWLDLCYTLNRGAAFGLLNHTDWGRWLFTAVAILALAVLIVCRRGVLRLPAVERLGLCLVAAGAAGNLIDRLLRDGAVVDFIRFHIASIGFVWPDFNVADIGVTVGMTIYLVHALVADWAPKPAAEPPADPAPAAEHEA